MPSLVSNFKTRLGELIGKVLFKLKLFKDFFLMLQEINLKKRYLYVVFYKIQE